MSLQAVQALVKKAFADTEFKRRFLSNPDEVLAQFDLTEEEKAALQRIQGHSGVMAASSRELDLAVGPLATWV